MNFVSQNFVRTTTYINKVPEPAETAEDLQALYQKEENDDPDPFGRDVRRRSEKAGLVSQNRFF